MRVCTIAGYVLVCSGCSLYRAFREHLRAGMYAVAAWLRGLCVFVQLMALKERTADVVQDVMSKAAADQQATAARLSKEHQAAMQRYV